MSQPPNTFPPTPSPTIQPGPSLAGSSPSTAPVLPLGAKGILGLLLTFTLLILSWSTTFSEMWIRWFPAWHRLADHPLMDRLSKGDSYYSHGPLVILTSLIIAYFIYQRIRIPASPSTSASILGSFLLVSSLFLHLLSVFARVSFVSGFALIGTLLGLLLIWGGWLLFRAYWLPAAVLIFMVPLPEVWINELNFALKGIASDTAVWITNFIFQIPTVKSGSYVYLPPGPDGIPKTLIVENVCGGLRSLISLSFFAALFAMVCRVKGPWRILMLALALPVAVACNVVRITSLNVVAHYFSVEAAGENSWFHGFSGMMVFILALAFLFLVEYLIICLARLFKRPWTDPRLLGYLDNLPKLASRPATPWQPRWLLALLLTLCLSLWWSRDIPRKYVGQEASRAVSTQADILGHHFTSRDLQLDAQTLNILETDDYLYRQFSSPGMSAFDLVIVFSANNRKGTHPPDVCLEGSGEKILTRKIQTISLPSGRPIQVRELITQNQSHLLYHVYLYKCGTSYTTSFFQQQAVIVYNGLLSRNTSGALIRISLPIINQDEESARRLALAAMQTLFPQIDERLP